MSENKQTRRNLELVGHITTVTEFANSPPGAEKKVRFGGGEYTLRLLPAMPVRQGGDIVAENVPFIPATTIRGALRRAAAEIAVSVFNQQVTLDEWLLFTVGGVKRGGKDLHCEPKKRSDYIENNPLVALFGAGKSDINGELGGMVGAKLHIAHAIPGPEVRAVESASARGHMDKNSRTGEVLNEEGLKQLQNYWEELAAQEKPGRKKKNASTDDDGNEEKKSKVVPIGMPLPGYEVIPRGVEIPHQITLAAVSPAQFRFFLETLRRFAHDPVLGAHRSHGCGRIRAEYAVYLRDDEGVRKWQGDIRIGHFPPENDGSESKTGKPGKKPWPPLGEKIGPFFSVDDGVKALSADWRENTTPDNLRPYPAPPAPKKTSPKK